MNKEKFYKDEALPDNQYKVEWTDEFGNVEVSEHDGGDLE